MRKLASIQTVAAVNPIPGADAIEVATINGWQVVVKKGEFRPGDPCVYFEVDSFLPVKPEYEFLRKSCWRKFPDGQEGFRLRTIKLRGQISQGLCLPVPPELSGKGIGSDVTAELGVTLYEPPQSGFVLSGDIKGPFPIFIPKTDEERVQNLTSFYPTLAEKTFYCTEKLDGSSATFYRYNGEFGVCSRNVELKESAENVFWKVAREQNIEAKLREFGGNIAIQGELIGHNIQGNKYKLKGHDFRLFNVYLIDEAEYLDFPAMIRFADRADLRTVPIISTDFELPTMPELIASAAGQSVLAPTHREGLVLRTHDRRFSFKVISNDFLLAEAL